MGLFERFSKALRANINTLLDKAEDPHKLLEQNLMDLAQSKGKAKKLLIKTMGAKKMAEDKLKACRKLIAELLDNAEAMLASHQEKEARELLAQKKALEQEKAEYEEEIKLHEQTITTIHQGCEALDEKIALLKAKRTAGEDSTKHPLTKGELDGEPVFDTSSFDTFSRMEEKIDQNEAELSAMRELLEDQDLQPSTPTAVAKKPQDLSLEEELDELRKKLKKK